MINEQTGHVEPRTCTSFLDEAQPRLLRAFVARFGIEDGLDAASETAAYAVEHWDRLQQMENPIGYLYRVGQSWAQRLSRQLLPIEVLVEVPAEHIAFKVDLQRALLKLKWEERVAIVLVHAHGHTYAATAEILDVPVTTINNHLHRGLASLRRRLEQ